MQSEKQLPDLFRYS